MQTLTRDDIERALRQALTAFPTDPRLRTYWLIGVLSARLDLDPTLARRFLAGAAILCD